MSYGRASDRKSLRQTEALIRNSAYQALSLYDKLAQQTRFRGKQYDKLVAQLKYDENNCHTVPDGACISPGPCLHSPK
jgi:hypothetical protein